MTHSSPTTEPARLSGFSKTLVEWGPLIAFFIGFSFHENLAAPVDKLLGTDFFVGEGRELYLAVLFSLPAFAAAFIPFASHVMSPVRYRLKSKCNRTITQNSKTVLYQYG